MTIDGVNGSKQIVPTETAGVQNDGTAVKDEKLNSVFENKTKLAPEAELPDKLPVPENEQEPEKMSRKEAKEWVKAYREENGCSKKEAKAAFEKEFGYKMPSSKFMQRLRLSLIYGNTIGFIVGLTHSQEQRDNFVATGKWKSQA